MPHYSNYGNTRFSAKPIDELTGNFDALNETTNVRPAKGESTSIVHPVFKTGYDTGPIGSLSETFGDSDPRILVPIIGEGVFKPQDIDTKGSVIWGDNHFKPGRDGDSLTDEGRPTKIWTNGGASTCEDRMTQDFDSNDVVFCNGITLDTEAPSMSMHQGAMNSVWGKDAAGNFRDAAGSMTEPFEPAAGINSFGESLNPVLELGGQAGPGGTTFMTGQFDMPTNNLNGSARPGGDDV